MYGLTENLYDWIFYFQASSRIKIDSEIVKRTLQRIKSKFLSESVFDEVAAKVGISENENPFSGNETSELFKA